MTDISLNQMTITPVEGDAVFAPNVMLGGCRLVSTLASNITAPTPLKLVDGSAKEILLDKAGANDVVFGVLKREPQKSVWSKNQVCGIFRANDIIWLTAAAKTTAGQKVYFDSSNKVNPTGTGNLPEAGIALTSAEANALVMVSLTCQYGKAAEA